MFTVSISGNIATGKSTLLKELRARGHTVFLEGLNRGSWDQLLELYYKNQEKYGYVFQTMVLADISETYIKIKQKENGIVFVERSHIDCLAFATLVHSNGHMTDVEFSLFCRLYNLVFQKPDKIIRLKLDPKICFERCKARGRKCEKDMSVAYLSGVEKHTANAHEKFVVVSIDVLGKTTASIADDVEKLTKELKL